MKLDVNGSQMTVPDDWQDEMLASVLREPLGLVGTRLGCGDGECGTCVVLIDGRARRSCRIPARMAVGRRIVTIEGLAGPDGTLHPLQQAWIDERVSQCGYCQAGQIMQALALLAENMSPDDAAIAQALNNNLCRCGTYDRVRRAVHRAAQVMRQTEGRRR